MCIVLIDILFVCLIIYLFIWNQYSLLLINSEKQWMKCIDWLICRLIDWLTDWLTFIFITYYISTCVWCTAEGRGRSWVNDSPGRLCTRAGCDWCPWQRCLNWTFHRVLPPFLLCPSLCLSVCLCVWAVAWPVGSKLHNFWICQMVHIVVSWRVYVVNY